MKTEEVEFEEVGRFMTAYPVSLWQGRDDLMDLFEKSGTTRDWILCINKRGDRCNAIHRTGHRFRFYGNAYVDEAHSINQHVRIARTLLR